MLGPLTRRVLPILQLTRIALVFTAVSNAVCALWLADAGREESPDWLMTLTVALMASGLYGFGMSLNDIVDHRRDRLIARGRPLPSGRIGLRGAHVVCALTLVVSLAAALAFLRRRDGPSFYTADLAWQSMILWMATVVLIAFYDFAGKYLITVGLLTLGLVRFANASIPAPTLPIVWQPLLLLLHVTLLSTLAYAWEGKRPSLRKRNLFGVLLGLTVAITAVLVWIVERRSGTWLYWAQTLLVETGLWLPAMAVGLFVLVAVGLRAMSVDAHLAGRRVMLVGLLWLIVYDAAFLAAYQKPAQATIILALLPIAYVSVVVMRWWSTLVELTQPPQFERAD